MFNLNTKLQRRQARLTLCVSKNAMYSSSYPKLTENLKEFLPSIYFCECFNEMNRPFSQELTDTEAGHLFEHILLEFLCLEKIKSGRQRVSFSGKTSWNWEHDEEGTFHIVIKGVKSADKNYFKTALNNTVALFERIIGSSENNLIH